MRRKDIVLLTVAWLILGMVSVDASHGKASPGGATLKAVTVSGPASGGDLLLQIKGEYSFQTVRATPETLFVDLKGVKAGGVAKTGQWSGGLLTGYRVIEYSDAAGQPVARVQVEMKHSEPFKVQQEAAGLRLIFQKDLGANPAPASGERASSAAAPRTPGAAPAKTAPVISSAGPAVVSGVSIQAGPNGETLVEVSTTRPTPYRVMQLKNPARLVVDLDGAHNGARQPIYLAHSPVLKGVRVGQFRAQSPAVVRVVADLIGDPLFDVHASSSGVRIAVKSRSLAMGSGAAKGAEAPMAAAKAEEKLVQASATEPTPAPSAERVERAAPPQPEPVAIKAVAAKAGPVATAPADYHNALPAAPGSKEVTATPRQEQPAPTSEVAQAARAAQVMASTSNLISSAPQGQTPAPAGATAQEQPKYTGEPISLNLKDVDLKDFFRLIHEISGLNIIVDPNVTGSVTLVLDAVPWDQALDIVLKNNRLGKTLEGNVLRIARIETLTAEEEANTKLAAAREEAQPLVTVFRPVNYAKASTIATMLKSWVGGGALSKRGNILVDDRTNTLIVSDIQSQIPVIESIIVKLDKRAKQVSIEARIVRANSDFSRSLAAALSGAYTTNLGTTTMAASTGTGVVGNTTGTPPLVTTGSAGGFGVYAITNAGNRYIINAVIAAAETRSQAKTISRPSIITQNNVAGTVQQGTQIPIQTTINNTISIQYISATLQMTVTPQVTEDGNIFLVVTVTNASPGAVLTSAGPSINTQSASTQVMVPDGGTVVFGGVTITSRSKSATYVPLLGSIPIVGHLFKTSNVQDSDQELLFFVSPKVLPG